MAVMEVMADIQGVMAVKAGKLNFRLSFPEKRAGTYFPDQK